MSDITSNIVLLKKQIPSSVKLVVVSKSRPVNDIIQAYESGHKCFGENRVQELLSKKDSLPADIEWHLIGHLQRNKVKLVIPYVSMIQSVDSFRLLSTINSESAKKSKVIDCLLQIHIAKEDTKFGFNMDELDELGRSHEFDKFENVRICGVMGMATFTSDTDQVIKEFSYLTNCFRTLKNKYFTNVIHFKDISMGMSGDYKLAIQEGSTLIRIGSHIFR